MSAEQAARVGRVVNYARVTYLEAALAATVASLDESRSEVHALEDELVAARATVDGWQNIAIQLAATCQELRETLTAARWAGFPCDERANHAK